jgi:GTP cyclohydrolase I
MQTILETQSLTNASLQELIREIMVRLGEDPDRDGLLHTPGRMERSMQFLTKGYDENPAERLRGAMFDLVYDEMVIVKNMEMFSLCEHPPSAVFRQGSRRLYSARESDWAQ